MLQEEEEVLSFPWRFLRVKHAISMRSGRRDNRFVASSVQQSFALFAPFSAPRSAPTLHALCAYLEPILNQSRVEPPQPPHVDRLASEFLAMCLCKTIAL